MRKNTNNEVVILTDHIDYFHPIDVMMFGWDFIDTLGESRQDEEYFRIERLTRCLPKVVDLDNLEEKNVGGE